VTERGKKSPREAGIPSSEGHTKKKKKKHGFSATRLPGGQGGEALPGNWGLRGGLFRMPIRADPGKSSKGKNTSRFPRGGRVSGEGRGGKGGGKKETP